MEKTFESLLDYKEIKLVNPKGIQPWIFIGRTDAEAEAPIIGHLLRREDSLEKTLMLGNIEGKKEKEAAKDEVAGWHHWLKGHESEQTLGDSGERKSLTCCSPQGHEESEHDTVTEQQQIHISIERASFTLCNNPFIVEEKELKRP